MQTCTVVSFELFLMNKSLLFFKKENPWPTPPLKNRRFFFAIMKFRFGSFPWFSDWQLGWTSQVVRFFRRSPFQAFAERAARGILGKCGKIPWRNNAIVTVSAKNMWKFVDLRVLFLFECRKLRFCRAFEILRSWQQVNLEFLCWGIFWEIKKQR